MKNLPFSRFLTTSFILFLLSFLQPGSSLFASGNQSVGSGTGLEGNSSLVYCATPTWLETSNITMTSATFSWDAVPGATSYSVQSRVPGGTWYNVPGSPVTNTWITVDWFLPNTTYEWRVKTNCYNGESSAWSNPVAFTTTGYGYCQAPAWLFTNNITQTSATLDWEPVSGAYSYTVQYRVAGGTWYDVPGGPFTDTWVNLTGLTPGTTYQWRVKTTCTNWTYSDWSYIAEFTTLQGYCNHPIWLYTSNLNFTSARLNWEYIPGAMNYTVQFRQQNGSWYELPGGPFEETWVNVVGLQPTTCYEWRVRTNCSNWTYSTWSYPEVFCTPGYSCFAPTWPKAYDIGQHSATLSWDPVPGAYHYVVEIRQGYNGEWVEVSGSPTPYYWLSVYDLTPCTTYQWRVKAHCHNGGYSYWSETASFTTYCEYYCHAPHWLGTTNITPTSATLEWSPVYGALSYTIQYRAAGGNWQYATGGPFVGTWTTIHNLQPGTTYEWRVRSNCSNWSYSPWSYPAWFTTPGGCHRPSFLFTKDITHNSATLDWSSVDGAWNYSVQYREVNTGPWLDVPGSPFTETIAYLTGLHPGTTYQWRVKSNCEDGDQSLWTKPATFTTLGIPECDAPYWLWTVDITESSAKLDWADVHDALYYAVQFRKPGEEWTDLPLGQYTETWYTASGLEPGTIYEWRVKSYCEYDLVSEWSQTATFTTLGPPCNAPEGLFADSLSDTSAKLVWGAVNGAVQYVVEIRVPYGIWSTVEGSPVSEATITAGNLIPGTAYEWRVRTICGNGKYSAWSVIASFATTGTAEAGSDECDGATNLSVNSSCLPVPSSNVGATESTPGPMGWCPENEYNDVWFKFNMPDVADPVVTIRTMAGTLTDGIMEVYRGADCGSLAYVFCEDDNSFNNSSHMPVISITGSANETIWVRVWGYAGTTGTFSICVFDYQSNDFAAPVSTSPVLEGEVFGEVQTDINESRDDASAVLEVHPNPASDVLNLTYHPAADEQATRIQMMDMSGKVVYDRSMLNNGQRDVREQIDVNDLTRGVFILKVVTTNGIISKKIMLAD